MKPKAQKLHRCEWATSEPSIAYHDQEWGVPLHDDRMLFEFLLLEGMQAGLSWELILKRREKYRQAFHNFDPRQVSRYDARKMRLLLANPGIVRNRLKIAAAVVNARAFLAVQKEFGSFDAYVWRFVNDRPIKRKLRSPVRSQTAESEALSRDLGGRGFKFVGPTICYAFMQAVGLVNDHHPTCFRYNQV